MLSLQPVSSLVFVRFLPSLIMSVLLAGTLTACVAVAHRLSIGR